jgi:hypothetical protein
VCTSDYEKENEQNKTRRHSATAGRQQHQTIESGEGPRPDARRPRFREIGAHPCAHQTPILEGNIRRVAMRRAYNNDRRQTEETQAARLRMLEMRGWKRLNGDKWLSPYSGCLFDTRGALDIEKLRGNWAKKMAAAFL